MQQLLAKTPNVPCRYRHKPSGIHYGAKKTGRKRKEHSLGGKSIQHVVHALEHHVPNEAKPGGKQPGGQHDQQGLPASAQLHI